MISATPSSHISWICACNNDHKAAGNRRCFCKRGAGTMSNNTLTYKGYVAKVEYDSKRELLYGTVQGSAMREF